MAMDSQRWQQIEDLYNAVLTRTPEERSALLDQADPETRREVELMLAQEGSLLDRPAWADLPDNTVTIFAAGKRLGRYEIEARLGAGGMGEVFRARDTRLNRTVALKVSKIQFNERFEREARAIAALNHPNICQVYDAGASPSGSGYLVMELIEGENPKGPLPLATVLKYAAQIAAGLEAAHEKGIVHRDLKPANLKITPAGVVKILDFGLAKAAPSSSAAQQSGDSPDSGLTQAGVILGTAPYMSPEQARGESVDKRTDIWAFGVIVYELLTGERLYKGKTATDVLAAVLTKQSSTASQQAPAPVLGKRSPESSA
jgi:serine/threonine protein kinase